MSDENVAEDASKENRTSTTTKTSNATSEIRASNVGSAKTGSVTSNASADRGASVTSNAASAKGRSGISNATSEQGANVTSRTSVKVGSRGDGRGVIVLLTRIREPLAEYQCNSRGISKYEQYSFLNLTSVLCQHASASMLTILTMLYCLIPLVDTFAYSLRFVLDKSIEIGEATCTRDKVFKSVIFLGELLVVMIMLSLIVSIILLPIVALTKHITNQIFGLFKMTS